MEFEKELQEEKPLETATAKVEKQLQVEEDATLADRLNTPTCKPLLKPLL